MPRTTPFLTRWLVLVLLSVSVAACRGETGSAPRRDEVRALLSKEPASLSLLGKTGNNSAKLAVQITDSLVQYDASMRLTPRVAESWEFSADRRTLTFHLRDGVRWHDGTPVTSHDVVFSAEQAQDPAVENRSFGPHLRAVDSVEAVDPRTVRVRYAEPDPDAVEHWRFPLIPRHLAESGADLLTGEFARHPVGCGPFRFVRYLPGEEIVLEANDDYWDGRPRTDRLVFRFVPDERTGLELLLAGDLDIMTVSPELWHEAQESERGSRLTSFAYYRTSVYTVRWNMDGSNPFFDDVRVRRAMVMATNRQQFIDRVLHGLGRVAVTSYHPDLAWTDPSIRPLAFDPEAAGRLLDEAGWIDRDGDGVRERDGRPFEFELMIVASTLPLVEQVAVWLLDSWRQVGVRATIDRTEWGLFRERRNAAEFAVVLDGFGTTAAPDQTQLYHSAQRGDGMNYGGFVDSEVDRLLDEGRRTFDPEARLATYHGLQARLAEEQPIGWLIHFATPVLHDRELSGVTPSPLDYWQSTDGPRLWHWAAVHDGG